MDKKKKQSRSIEKTKPSLQRSSGYRAADESGIPVPSRLMLIEFLTEIGEPVTFQAICRHFQIREKEAKQSLNGRLERLQNQGVVIVDRRKRFALPDKMGAFVGRVIGHANGFGFVRPDKGGDDLYLHHKQMRKVLHGDRVVAKLKSVDSRGRSEGVIVEVIVDLEREIVGHFHFESGVGFVEPDDSRFARDIAIPSDQTNDAQNGDIVVVKLLRHPVQHQHAVGKISHIMGNELAPGMEIDIAIRKHEIPWEWPAEVDQQLDKDRTKFQSAKLDKNRKDVRNLPLVTIDGEDARDFDDAVYCKPNAKGWRLVVAIADVSHYVKVGSPMDQEAYRRGNSVYFPNRVIPMLPEMLSNGICSLNPEEDRCCMVCDMQLDNKGKVINYSFYPGLMHSKARLTYTLVAGIVDHKDEKLRDKWRHVISELDDLYSLYQVMNKQRDSRGTINFSFPEPFIHFDEQQRIDQITVRDRNVAHRMIEECMLAANVCAGELIQEAFGEFGIYRNHAGPDQDKLKDLHAFLQSIGLYLKGDDAPDAGNYAELLEQAANRPEIFGMVQTVLLRSLSQAQYSPELLGHFALSFPVYTHFTSPIRRYPDLVVHRLIRNHLDKKRKKKVAPYDASAAEVGENCSFTERRAEDATRDVVSWLKAEFMQDKIGEEFSGVISGVKEFGIFVTLDHIFVDGLVHVTGLGKDYFHFDPQSFQLVGERNGRRFRLGDRVTIIVAKVDLDLARIDFDLADIREKDGKRKFDERVDEMSTALKTSSKKSKVVQSVDKKTDGKKTKKIKKPNDKITKKKQSKKRGSKKKQSTSKRKARKKGSTKKPAKSPKPKQ